MSSYFWTGSNRYLFLVVSDKEYRKAAAEIKYTAPTKLTEPTPASAQINTRKNTVDYNIVKNNFVSIILVKKIFFKTIMFHDVS